MKKSVDVPFYYSREFHMQLHSKRYDAVETAYKTALRSMISASAGGLIAVFWAFKFLGDQVFLVSVFCMFLFLAGFVSAVLSSLAYFEFQFHLLADANSYFQSPDQDTGTLIFASRNEHEKRRKSAKRLLFLSMWLTTGSIVLVIFWLGLFGNSLSFPISTASVANQTVSQIISRESSCARLFQPSKLTTNAPV